MRNLLGLGLVVLIACGRVADEQSAPAAATSGASGSASSEGGGGAVGVAGSPLAQAGESAGGSLAGAGAGSAGASGAAGAAPGPHPYRALHIAVGAQHSCALLEDHQLKCWGFNGYGQLGLGTTAQHGLTGVGDELPLVELGAGRWVKSVAAGRYSTCAILDDDSVKCWGLNIMASRAELPVDRWMLGDEPNELGDALPPVPLGAGHRATKVAIGQNTGCIALEDDSFVCGGTSNEFGVVRAALGVSLLSLAGSQNVLGLYDDGSLRWIPAGTQDRPEPIKNDVAIVGGASNCSVTWSRDQMLSINGQPSVVVVGPVYSIAATEQCRRVCAILGDHRVHCWRWLGSSLTDQGRSVIAALPTTAVELAGGSYEHFCALLEDGSVWCWDWQSPHGAAAVGGAVDSPKPVDLGLWRPR